MSRPTRVLVTGGSGFLGLEICRQLAAQGTHVTSLCRRPSPQLARLGVHQHLGDLVDPSAVSRAVAGCDAVVHNAALAGVSGPARPFWTVNVEGTRNVVAQCRDHQVRTLVYTSTASVVFPPGGLDNADDRTPYPRRHLAAYPRTKARAEALVLAANGPGLATVSLRPHLIWGPDDPHFLPALLRMARRGRFVLPGDGTNLIDTTHVRTAAHAHLLALDRLHHGHPIGGRAYFITQGEPLPLGTVVDLLLGAAGMRVRRHAVPVPLAYAAAAARDAAVRVTSRGGVHGLSRFLVDVLARPHWFDLTAARRDLGFTAPISIAEGIAELEEKRTPHVTDARP
ncbi:NAD-dependent epimerase/dehydratase family protein [Streptomyces sp. NPDC021096]|uniref:NAD-dependent epimerase/dehydratase family protein n=1 Tax=Streptomyces sp. NPDC021096 TaxID=3154792 RepID=UPI0033E0D51C